MRGIALEVNGRPAFARIDWEIRKGEHWAVLGPTGSGKTLLAKIISRQISVRHGELGYFFDAQSGSTGRPYLLPGEILTLSAESHRSFLRRYAGYHQARWQSIEGQDVPSVADLFSSAPAGTPSGRLRIVRLLRLEQVLERKVLHLSHGESRKVHLAFLLLQKPRLLILDDPYAGLDSQSRMLFTRAMAGLLRQETPQLLLLGSRVDELPEGFHQLLLVENLEVRAQGTRDAILERYRRDTATVRLSTARDLAPFERAVAQFADALDRPSALAAEMVRMDAVSVNHGAVRVLHQVSWVVRRGERWSLSGPNGAGKTTLLSLILGDHPQSYANEIFLFGRRRGTGESIWEIKRNIGWVSPELQIHYPRAATCLDVVNSGYFDSVGLFRCCTAQQTALANGWLEAFGILEFAPAAFHSLSSGQQRLVLLARALVKDPPLLILDEPCQGLDAVHRRALIDLIDRICLRTSLTVIYVTHYPDELPGAVTHHLRLEQGQVVQRIHMQSP